MSACTFFSTPVLCVASSYIIDVRLFLFHVCLMEKNFLNQSAAGNKRSLCTI
jgi:hypothetical protein